MEDLAFKNLRVEQVPGTEIMKDVGNIHFAHGPKSNQVLIPRPSDDPEDPLNWKRTWKFLAIFVQITYCWVTVASALSVAPMFPLLAAEFDLDQTQLNLITGSCVLALGYANFIIVPASNIFGRRPTSIFLALLAVGSCIWEAEAKSYKSLIGARVVNGFATATSETMAVQVICDLFFLHERGVWMGVYFFTYFLGLFIGPIISGAIASRHGWRSFFWLSLGLTSLNVLSLIFFFPETKFSRIDGLATSDVTAPSQGTNSPPEKRRRESSAHQEESPDAEATDQSQRIGTGRPSRKQFNLFSKPDPAWKSFIFKDIVTSVRIFAFPIVFWAATTVAGFANLLLLWNLTQSAVLGEEPYNFSVSAVGYSNFAFVVGGLVGLATGGPLSDWIASRATRVNDGIRQPEMRLPTLVPYFALSIIAVTIGGLAEQHLWDWPILVVVGYGISGMCITAAPAIAIAYAIDSYKPVAGEIMVVATVVKNTCGFSMSYWVPDVTEKMGNITPAMIQLALTAGPVLFALPLWLWGRKLRWYTRNSRVFEMEM